MTDFDALRARVEETATRLTTAQADRTRRSEDLLSMLGRLEQKFDAQDEQLGHYRARIDALESSNDELCALMLSLISLVDTEFAIHADDPLQRASDMAARMLKEDLVSVTTPAAAIAVAPPAAAPTVAATTTDAPAMRFEDVSLGELEAEVRAEDYDGMALPETVRAAEAAAVAPDANPLASGDGAVAAPQTFAEMVESALDDDDDYEVIDDDFDDDDEPVPDAGARRSGVGELTASGFDGTRAELAASATAAIADASDFDDDTLILDTPVDDDANDAEDAALVLDTPIDDDAEATAGHDDFAAGIDIPALDLDMSDDAEREVAEALEEALENIEDAEAAAEGGDDAAKPNIRSLLKRVEEAALRARALTESRERTKVAGTGADAAEPSQPSQTDHDTEAA